MFVDSIHLINNFPKSLFTRCANTRSKTWNDYTWEMTAALLLYSRVDNPKISLNIDQIDNIDPDVYSLTIFNNFNTSDDLESTLSTRLNSKIVRLETHEKYIKTTTNANICLFLAPELNKVFVYSKLSIVDLRVYHLLVSFFPAYFKDLFKKKPLTKDEQSFLQTLTESTSSNYTARVAALSAARSFRQFAMRYVLNDFNFKMYEKQLRAAEKEQENCRAAMDDALQKYSLYYEKLEKWNIQIRGFRAAMEEDHNNNEFKEYLLNNKNLMLLRAEDARLYFNVMTFLDPYEFEVYENISRHNTYAHLFANAGIGFSERDAKMLLDAIFSRNNCLKLRICASIILDFNNASCVADKLHRFELDDKLFENYLSNPHLDYYNCFGQNMADIIFNMTHGDPEGTIECVVNSVKQVNVAEDVSFGRLVKALAISMGKCLVSEDGTEMTAHEAIKYLKEKNNG